MTLAMTNPSILIADDDTRFLERVTTLLTEVKPEQHRSVDAYKIEPFSIITQNDRETVLKSGDLYAVLTPHYEVAKRYVQDSHNLNIVFIDGSFDNYPGPGLGGGALLAPLFEERNTPFVYSTSTSPTLYDVLSCYGYSQQSGRGGELCKSPHAVVNIINDIFANRPSSLPLAHPGNSPSTPA